MPNFFRGSWLCDWPWPIAPGAHLVVQAREDLTSHGCDGPATRLLAPGIAGLYPLIPAAHDMKAGRFQTLLAKSRQQRECINGLPSDAIDISEDEIVKRHEGITDAALRMDIETPAEWAALILLAYEDDGLEAHSRMGKAIIKRAQDAIGATS